MDVQEVKVNRHYCSICEKEFTFNTMAHLYKEENQGPQEGLSVSVVQTKSQAPLQPVMSQPTLISQPNLISSQVIRQPSMVQSFVQRAPVMQQTYSHNGGFMLGQG